MSIQILRRAVCNYRSFRGLPSASPRRMPEAADRYTGVGLKALASEMVVRAEAGSDRSLVTIAIPLIVRRRCVRCDTT